eukprot:COSAG06_NODE_10426_length_1683_cov_1.627525_2_plen_69_part_00
MNAKPVFTPVCENGSFEPFIHNAIFLPRQVRENHREISKKTTAFSGENRTGTVTMTHVAGMRKFIMVV